MDGITKSPFVLVDWLESNENHLADAFEQTLEDDATLEFLAQAWKATLTGLSLMPGGAPLQPSSDLGMPLSRGGVDAPPTGLGADYPTELARLVKTGWSSAARALGFQQAFVPFAFGEATELYSLADVLDRAAFPRLCPTENRILREEDGLRVRRMNPNAASEGTPLVVLSSFINRWYILDLLEGHSFLQMLGTLNRPLYLLEWLPPGGPVDERSLADLTAGPLLSALDFVRGLHGVPAVPVIGYSMGGTVAAILAARYPDRVSGISTVCSPVRFSEGGVFTRWLSPRFLDVELVVNAYAQIPASVIHLPFWWLRPTIKTKKMVQLSRAYSKPGFIEQFLAAEIWNYDNVDVSRGVFRSWAGELYQNDALIRGQFYVDGKKIDLRNITCPVLAISGSEDKIVPPETAEGLVEACSSPVKRALRVDKAHHVRILTAKPALLAEAEEFQRWLNASAEAPKAVLARHKKRSSSAV